MKRFMPAFTTFIRARIEVSLRDKFKAIANASNVSESILLRRVILKEVEQVDTELDAVIPDPDNTEITKMTVRFPGFLSEVIKERSKASGMSASRWVAALVQSNLTRVPVVNQDAVNQLRTSNRELAAIGRNINQIARALNHRLQDSEPFPLQRLKHLGQVIITNQNNIDALIRASNGVWEVD